MYRKPEIFSNDELRKLFNYLETDYNFVYIDTVKFDRDFSYNYYYNEISNVTLCIINSSSYYKDIYIIKGRNFKFCYPFMTENEMKDAYSIIEYSEYITNGYITNNHFTEKFSTYNSKFYEEILTNYLSDVLLGVKWWNPKDEINANKPKPNFLQKIGKFIFKETTPKNL